MSIVREYEEIRRELGEDKFQAIEEYLEIHTEVFLSDVYYKESEFEKFEEWYYNRRQKKLIEDGFNQEARIKAMQGYFTNEQLNIISCALYNFGARMKELRNYGESFIAKGLEQEFEKAYQKSR